MIDLLLILLLAGLAGGILWYLIRAKRKGETCIGCPYAKTCGKGPKCSCGTKQNDNPPS